jgi:hypothetical protein
VFVHAGRFACRLSMMSCWRRSAFSAISWDLLFPKSVRVASGKDVPSGLVQRVKREVSASKQLFFSCRRWVSHTSHTRSFSIP